MTSKTSLLPLAAALLAACAVACGAETPGLSNDSDTDDLSDSTVSMEMVRQNPALAPGVALPEGKKVNGHARPRAAGTIAPLHDPFNSGPGSFLYDANGLGQFKQLPDPALHKDDLKAATLSRKPGDLFAADNKLTWDNVALGGLGDCYFAAGFSAVLFADKGGALTQNLIKPNLAAGKVVSYTVTFFQASGRKVAIEVDPDLPHDNVSGDVFYMSSTDNQPGYEEWAPSLVEKAYAKWHRSYNAIGNGGTAADVLYALTGKKTRMYSPKGTAVVAAVEAASNAGRAQAACTFEEKGGPVDYTGTGIHGDHCYTLRGIERSGGQVFVLLRNPWGPWKNTEPPDDGVQDGIFKLELSKFAKYYADVTIVQ
jgi:hypothetical protein